MQHHSKTQAAGFRQVEEDYLTQLDSQRLEILALRARITGYDTQVQVLSDHIRQERATASMHQMMSSAYGLGMQEALNSDNVPVTLESLVDKLPAHERALVEGEPREGIVFCEEQLRELRGEEVTTRMNAIAVKASTARAEWEDQHYSEYEPDSSDDDACSSAAEDDDLGDKLTRLYSDAAQQPDNLADVGGYEDIGPGVTRSGESFRLPIDPELANWSDFGDAPPLIFDSAVEESVPDAPASSTSALESDSTSGSGDDEDNAEDNQSD